MNTAIASQVLPPLQISQRVSSIGQALSIYINQLVYDFKRQGRKVTTLSLGEAFFDLPLFDFNALDRNAAFHYTDSRGIPELREKIAAFYRRQYGATVDSGTEVLVTAGSKPAIFMAMQAILNAGDIVLIHEPAWLSYQEHARLLDAVPRFIPYDASIESFAEYFDARTRIVVINNPNNPGGRLYSEEELLSIHRQCREHGVYLLVDEAYSDFVLDEPFASIARVVPSLDGIVLVNSLSKNLGMSGWRIGYVIAAPTFLAHLLKLNQHLITCAPSILQHYVATYFDDIIAITLPQVRTLLEKRLRIASKIDTLGLKRLPGNSTFYFFLSIGDFPGSSLELATHLLLEHNIAVVPGSAYGDSTERFVRVSIGTESTEAIEQALEVYAQAISSTTFDAEGLHRRLQELGLPAFRSAKEVLNELA